MAEEKDIIGREEPLNEDASTPETADEAADETPAAGPQGKAGKFDRLTQDEGGVRKLTGMYKNWFLDYASYVILERAVPHVEDGLKPVQRRILHAMKVVDDGRYNKVANIVGQTMQYHPHGDASIKDALVQLGQKDLLIDCQGNWGNILTGDEAAAGRYIEAEPVPAPVDASARTSAADGAAEVTIQRPAPVAAPVPDEPDESPFLEIPLTEEVPATVAEPAPSRSAGPRIVGGDDVFTEVDLSGGEADAAFTAPREPEQPQYASEPAPVVDGITEYTLTAEPEIPAEGVVVTVEAREAKVVDEKSIESSLYDPLKDLNNYQRPPVTLLEDYTSDSQVSDEEIYENKSKIEQTLKDFGIPIQRIKATVGPTVTLYEIVQAQGVKISKIQGLENDIAQSLKALGIRIIAPIPGKGTICLLYTSPSPRDS